MSTVTAFNIVSFVSLVLTILGITGVTSQDITGAVNVGIAVIGAISVILSHFAHRAQVQGLSAGAVKS